MRRVYGGELIEYFFYRERSSPMFYAYGIRYLEPIGAHLIRTSPITDFDANRRRFRTIYKFYSLYHEIDDPAYKALICDLFGHIKLPDFVEELILGPASLIVH